MKTNDAKFGAWVASQRQAFKENTLSQNQIDKLNSIGFCWNMHDSFWDKNFEKLLIFKEKHGHMNISHRYIDNTTKHKGVRPLAVWATKQRRNFKENKISQDKIDKLNSIGFPWDLFESTWEKHFEELLNFKKKHGHVNVPRAKDKKNEALAIWVANQRKEGREKTLSQIKFDKLNSIGFCWNMRKSCWDNHFEKLLIFKKKHGHITPSRRDKKNKSIAYWINSQRKLFKNKTLSQERIDKLNSIGFVWNTNED